MSSDTERKIGAAAARLTLDAMARAKRAGDSAEASLEHGVLRVLLEHPRNRPGPSMVQHLAMSFPVGASPDADAVEARVRARLAEAAERVQRSQARDELALDVAVAQMLD